MTCWFYLHTSNLHTITKRLGWKNYIALFSVSIEHLKNVKYHTSFICSKCKNEDENVFKEEESIEILKILGLIETCNYFENMVEEDISQEVRLKKIDETRNYFLEEIKQNELMSIKHKKVCITLNYIKPFLILASTITGSISISAFASLLGIPIRITSSATGLEIFAIATGIKKCKSIIKKN